MYSCETQRGRGIGTGKMRLHAGSLMWDMIPQDPGIMTLAKAHAQHAPLRRMLPASLRSFLEPSRHISVPPAPLQL